MWRRYGRLTLAAAIATTLLLIWYHHHHHLHNHRLRPDGTLAGIPSLHPDAIRSTHNWGPTCRDHGFSPFSPARKIYDLVLFNTELDLLEIRLHSHADFVDYFVVIESPTTFTHRSKPLHLKENWDRFREFHPKIIYRVVSDPIVSDRHWDHEDYLRNALLLSVFPDIPPDSPQTPNKGDVLLVSDMDELLKPATLLLLRHCAFPSRLTLRSYFYYYSFQWLHRGEQWAHPQATTYSSSLAATLPPNNLRQNLLDGRPFTPLASLSRWWESANLWNAGWHCSSCFSSLAELRTKMDSFSHQGWNTEENRKVGTMVERVRNGLDLFGRPHELYDRVDGNTDVPGYILQQFEKQRRFGHMLDRDGEGAAFEDWEQL